MKLFLCTSIIWTFHVIFIDSLLERLWQRGISDIKYSHCSLHSAQQNSENGLLRINLSQSLRWSPLDTLSHIRASPHGVVYIGDPADNQQTQLPSWRNITSQNAEFPLEVICIQSEPSTDPNCIIRDIINLWRNSSSVSSFAFEVILFRWNVNLSSVSHIYGAVFVAHDTGNLRRMFTLFDFGALWPEESSQLGRWTIVWRKSANIEETMEIPLVKIRGTGAKVFALEVFPLRKRPLSGFIGKRSVYKFRGIIYNKCSRSRRPRFRSSGKALTNVNKLSIIGGDLCDGTSCDPLATCSQMTMGRCCICSNKTVGDGSVCVKNENSFKFVGQIAAIDVDVGSIYRGNVALTHTTAASSNPQLILSPYTNSLTMMNDLRLHRIVSSLAPMHLLTFWINAAKKNLGFPMMTLSAGAMEMNSQCNVGTKMVVDTQIISDRVQVVNPSNEQIGLWHWNLRIRGGDNFPRGDIKLDALQENWSLRFFRNNEVNVRSNSTIIVGNQFVPIMCESELKLDRTCIHEPDLEKQMLTLKLQDIQFNILANKDAVFTAQATVSGNKCLPQCHANAACKDNGRCECLPGYEGDGVQKCFSCDDCSPLARCDRQHLKCVCRDGYVGNGVVCLPERPGVCYPMCHKKAFCSHDNRCNCRYGYVGDGVRHCVVDCTTCHEKSDCDPQLNECRCRTGYYGDGFECRQSCCEPKCHIAAQCIDGRCICHSALVGDGIRFCFNCSNCDLNADCVPNEQRCQCRPGWKGNGFQCEKKVPCKEMCHLRGECVNGACACWPGLQGDGVGYCFNCSQCDRNAVCLVESETCRCQPDYVGNGTKCKKTCEEPCHTDGECVDGQCVCKSGFVGDGKRVCFDCYSCHANADCVPHEEKCVCRKGWIGDGKTCYKQPECPVPCHTNAECVNGRCQCRGNLTGDGVTSCFNCSSCAITAKCQPDKNKCVCMKGYEGDGRQCEPIPVPKEECNPPCHANGQCTNRICFCKRGFVGDGVTMCFNCSTCHPFADCVIYEGKCQCQRGWIGDGVQCQKTDSSVCGQRRCHENAVCIDELFCQCRNGLIGDGERVCMNCSMCHANAFCQPEMEKCQCQPGFVGDGKWCLPSGNGTMCDQRRCHSQAACVSNSVCQCLHGLQGDGETSCFNCSQCSADAVCLPNQQRCACREDFKGDGVKCTRHVGALCANRRCHVRAKCKNDMTCECPANYSGDGINSCFDCSPCSPNADCDPNNEKCQCKSGYEGDGRSCKPIPVTCSPLCHVNATCQVNNQCLCHPGLTGDGRQTCFDCRRCHSNATCIPQKNICECLDGFIGDGIGCIDLSGRMFCGGKDCHPDAQCINNTMCQCKSGFIGDGQEICFNCSQCSVNADCRPDLNRCICRNGYEGDGRNCVMPSTPDALCNRKRCHENATCINNSFCQCKTGLIGDGEFICMNCTECDLNAFCRPDLQRCICNDGFEGDGKTCERRTVGPICSGIPCHVNATCVRKRQCRCKFGLVGNGVTVCMNCSECHQNAICEPDLQKCICMDGYEGDGKICVKTNVTDTLLCNGQQCHENATCINNQYCECHSGLLGDGYSYCMNCSQCHPHSECRIELQQCKCREGFLGDGKKCKKVKPDCPVCHPQADCINGTCRCRSGLDGDGLNSCFDCRKQCDPNSICLPSASKCICRSGFNGDGRVCTPNPEGCDLRCHANAQCQKGSCVCKEGFEGDGVRLCFNCSQCDKLAICLVGDQRCECVPPYSGNGTFCTKPDFPGSCPQTCHPKGVCINGKCSCGRDLIGDGVNYCFDCTRCHPMGVCVPHEQRCECMSEYKGDGINCELDLIEKVCFPPCLPEASCHASVNQCFCDPGLSGDGRLVCFNCSQCHPNATCHPEKSQCECNSGFEGDGITCRLKGPPVCETTCHRLADCVNGHCQCRLPSIGDGINSCFDCFRCHPKAVCLPSEEKCVCQIGYQGNGEVCEVKPKSCPSACHKYANCKNGYCECLPDHLGDGINYCFACSKCHPKAHCQPHEEKCVCQPGFIGDGFNCIPEEPPCPTACHKLAICHKGQCQCLNGFVGDGLSHCFDCRRCDKNAICDSRNERCVCNSGYDGNGEICEPKKQPECRPSCHGLAKCDRGKCVCQFGLSGDGIRQCFNCSLCPKYSRCVPELQSCACNPGYVKVNEICVKDCQPPCHPQATCVQGDCICKTPLRGDGISSCYNCSQCHSLAECRPLEQRCYCLPGLIGDGIQCNPPPKECRSPCHQLATCQNGQCICNVGLSGDGVSSCFNCSRCHSQATCQANEGRCVCVNNTLGDGFTCRFQELSCPQTCHKLAACRNGQCQCFPGLQGDGVGHCFDCSLCSLNAFCLVNESRCQCLPGFLGNGMLCELNKTECSRGCHSNARCVNNCCQCRSGYVGDGVTYCFQCSQCSEFAYCVAHQKKCVCREGFVGDGKVCVPVPVCSLNCSLNAECINGHCRCRPGFTGDGVRCADCRFCHPQAYCSLESGGCKCLPGFMGDGLRQCLPQINEQCKTDWDCIDNNAFCALEKSNDGSLQRKCLCKLGFQRNNSSNKCVPIDCVPPCGLGASCIAGMCQCPVGWRGDPSREGCQPSSTCQQDSDCTESGAVCRFIPGKGRQCVCAPGLSRVNGSCVSTPCQPPCHPLGMCILGTCMCQAGYKGDGINQCIDCSRCDPCAICTPQEGCLCRPGYRGNGTSCDKVETPPQHECQLDRDCGAGATCSPKMELLPPNSFPTVQRRCECLPTHQWTGKMCVPSVCSPPCDPNADCVAARCICRSPHYLGNGFQCQRKDVCERDNDCPDPNHLCLRATDLSLQCQCRPGYQWMPKVVNTSALIRFPSRNRRQAPQSFMCSKIECPTPCHVNAICNHRRECVCEPGYSGDGYKQCFDCRQCHPKALCDTRVGVCTCQPGYQGDGMKQCQLIDACRTDTDCQDTNAVCQQTWEQTHQCICKEGYERRPGSTKCQMKNCPKVCHPDAICQEGTNCICKEGFRGDGYQCYPLQCKTTKDCRDPNAVCISGSDGTRKCVCGPGYVAQGSSKCTKVVCFPSCQPDADCMGPNGQCVCRSGFFGDGARSCASCKLCHAEALCLPSGCVCKTGWVGDGFQCFPPDECRLDSDCRDSNSLCQMTQDRNRRCLCKTGYQRVNEVCEKKDCPFPCGSSAECVAGQCVCRPGFQGNGYNCTLTEQCSSWKPCLDPSSVCQQAANKTFVCVCKEGFELKDGKCSTRDCPMQCHQKAFCDKGLCKCLPGFMGNGVENCIDCQKCHFGALCTSLGCICKEGYQGNGLECKPVDECRYDTDCHDGNAICLMNRVGSRNCICKPGYVKTGPALTCESLKCENDCGPSATCIMGQCQCNIGYVKIGTRCSPSDICKTNEDCPAQTNQFCAFIPRMGEYRCVCKEGSEYKNGICQPKDGCSTPCHVFASCQNGVCMCLPGFQGDGTLQCHDCSRCHGNSTCQKDLGCVCLLQFIGDGIRECRLRDTCQFNSDCQIPHQQCLLHRPDGNLQCQCRQGYTPSADKRECLPLPCEFACPNNSKCIEGQCRCDTGYRAIQDEDLLGTSNMTCIPEDDCLPPGKPCKGPNEICQQQADFSYRCQCAPGYQQLGGACQPMNCLQACHVDAVCITGICQCLPSFVGDGIRYCRPRDQCEVDADCKMIPGSVCTHLPGQKMRQCNCESGYELRNNTCVKQDCSPPCDPNAVCMSGKCLCKEGFQGTGVLCRPINDCNPSQGCVDPNAQCINDQTVGKFVCSCVAGYETRLISGQVQCLATGCGDRCHKLATCVQDNCVCLPPLIGNGYIICRPEDECQKDTDCSGNNVACVMTPELYRKCDCKPGYVLLPNDSPNMKRECLPIPCKEPCHEKSTCVLGMCECSPPYQGDGVKQCSLPDGCLKDEDCLHRNRLCDRQPWQVFGKCICKPGFVEITGNQSQTTCTRSLAPIEVIVTPRFTRIKEGSPLFLTCQERYGQVQAMELTFSRDQLPPDEFHDGVIFTVDTRMNTKVLLISKTSAQLDSGIYKCCARTKCVAVYVRIDSNPCGTQCQERSYCDEVSRTCVCQMGYKKDMSTGICEPDNCLAFPSLCDKTTQECINGVCVCKREYFKVYDKCYPKPGCYTSNDCDINGLCKQTGISRVCECLPGFLGDGKTCNPVTLTCQVLNNCPVNAGCLLNTKTDLYECICKTGYIGDANRFCEKKIDCDKEPSPCGPYSYCVKELRFDSASQGVVTQGVCRCEPSYSLVNNVCVDSKNLRGNLLVAQGSNIFYRPITLQSANIALRRRRRSISDPATNTSSIQFQLWYPEQDGDVVAIAVDCIQRNILWTTRHSTDIRKGSLKMAPFDTLRRMETLLKDAPGVEGLAVDWMAGNVFWTSSILKSVMVTRIRALDGVSATYYTKTLFTGILFPRAIVVDLNFSMIYWTVWERSNPRIEASTMDGGDRRILVNQLTMLPNGLTLDEKKQRLCWIEARAEASILADVSGTRLRCISLSFIHVLWKAKIGLPISGNSTDIDFLYGDIRGHPFGLSLDENGRFYWTSWETPPQIHILNTNRKHEVNQPPSRSKLHGIHVLPTTCPEGFSPCSSVASANYGNCKYLCLPRMNGDRVCECPDGSSDCQRTVS